MVKTRLPHRCRSPECQGGTVFTRRLEELLGRHSLLWEAVRPLLEVREKARREIAGLYRKLLGLARTDVDGRRSMTVPGIGRIERRRLVGIQQRLGVLAAACVDGDAAPRVLPLLEGSVVPKLRQVGVNRPGCAWYPGSGRRARYRRRVSSNPMSSSPGSRARVPSTAPPAWRHRARDSASRNSMPIFSTMARTRSWVSARR